jgi:predicted nucleic acid-binding protein
VSERIVINTGPLVSLARIGCLEILSGLPYEFFCPEQVRRELEEGEAAGLSVTGSLGLLGKAKMLGLVPSLKPLLEKAIAEGIRYHPELVRSILEAVGEEEAQRRR